MDRQLPDGHTNQAQLREEVLGDRRGGIREATELWCEDDLPEDDDMDAFLGKLRIVGAIVKVTSSNRLLRLESWCFRLRSNSFPSPITIRRRRGVIMFSAAEKSSLMLALSIPTNFSRNCSAKYSIRRFDS